MEAEPFLTPRTWRAVKEIALGDGAEPRDVLRRLLSHSAERELLRVGPRLRAEKARAKAA
jgi:hypothetical protein